MNRLLRHILGLCLLLGLVGNGVAVAAPCILMAQNQASAMADMPGCDMARPAPTDHRNEKGKAPGCMATVACAAVLAMKEPASTATPRARAGTITFWPATAMLIGRNVSPEPEPPTLLG